MDNFIKPMGSLPSTIHNRPRIFNPKVLRDKDDRSIEQQYAEAKTKEERDVLYKKVQEKYERERMTARMLIQ
jgi:hypothetical protein